MKVMLFFKKLAECIPYPIGHFASHVPYSWRLGSTYSNFSKLIPAFENSRPDTRLEYVIKNLNTIVQYAQRKIPFYQDLYGRSHLRIEKLSDFESLPIITRKQVRAYTEQSSGAMLLNTGGSTGGPLSFYVDKNTWSREWAHVHHIWTQKGYRHTDLMLTMLGKPLPSRISKYNVVHNEILINPYENIASVASEFVNLMKRYPIRYFQGYPSNIYYLFKAGEAFVEPAERRRFTSSLKCLLFSSEYPSENMVRYLSSEWGLKEHLSWYGHSEMCVFAYDRNSSRDYHPLYTYGYAEEKDGMLLGTSFHNFDMPLIRYMTEDMIDATIDDVGLITTFRIAGGRSSDFIEDRCGRRLSLTFFLGRHHTIYNFVDFIQIYQARPGEATYYIVPSKGNKLDGIDLRSYFDLPEQLAISFTYSLIDAPIRTKRGKLKLKLTDEDIGDLKLRSQRNY